MTRSPSRSDLETFRAALAEQTGLEFGDRRLVELERALADRMHDAGCRTVMEYLDGPMQTPAELAELARSLTVSETYFFRNLDHFRAVEQLVAERDAAGERRLRILSAGCSSGEEAFSLAITMLETVANPGAWNVSIRGVDLNPGVLEAARAGVFGKWSLRQTPDRVRGMYFDEADGRFRLIDSVREMVQFEQANLTDSSADFWRDESYDLVFLRNVLIYFGGPAARRVVARIARSLSPGGHLFLGHAENLRGLSHEFNLVHSHDTFYYQRRDSSETTKSAGPIPISRPQRRTPPRPINPDFSWFEAISDASNRIEQISRDATSSFPSATANVSGGRAEAASPDRPRDLSPAMDLMREERFGEALHSLSGISESAASDPDGLLLRATLLVSTGALEEAEAQCEALLEIDDLNAGAHYVLALCREHASDRDDAIEHHQAAAYLDPDFAMPHVQLGRLARRTGDLRTARRELELAIELLEQEEPARIILFGGGFGRQALIQLCRGELGACEGEDS